MQTVTAAKAREMMSAPKRSKYGVRNDAGGKAARTADGILFDSAREAQRYGELKLLVKAGEIHGLELQPEYELRAWLGGVEVPACATVGVYKADFRYFITATGEQVTEDAKGIVTDVYSLKKKIVLANYGVKIREV
jgi:Protein of unknown function (DUF1064).